MHLGSYAQENDSAVIEIGPNESMSIVGKGPGQDAAINPYLDEKCIAIVTGVGKNSFKVRIQSEGTILKTVPVAPGETMEFELEPGIELYFDSKKETKAKVNFKPVNGE